MDLKCKGITWVGNICQKLESMCAEVENIVCEEAKHVESQVQTVGINVKKMYADVVQELLPPTIVDPIKETGSELSLGQNADVGTYTKSKVHSDKDPIQEKTSTHKKLGVIASAEKDSSQTSFSNGVSKKRLLGIYRKCKVASDKDSVKEKTYPHKELGVIAPEEKYSSQTSLSNGVSNVNPLLGTLVKSNIDSSKDPIEEKMSPHKKLGVIAPAKRYSSQTSVSNGVNNVNLSLGTYKKSKVASGEDPIKEKTSPHEELGVIAPAEKDSSQTSLSNGVGNVNPALGTYKKSKVASDKDPTKGKTSPHKELGVIAPAEKDSSQTSFSNGVSNANPLLGTCKKSKVASAEDPIEKTSPHKELGVIAPADKYSSQTSFSIGVSNVNPLLPKSSVDPVKRAALDSSLEGSDVLMYKISEAVSEEDPIRNTVSAPGLSEKIVPVESEASLLSSLCNKNNTDPLSVVDSVKVVGSDLSLEQNDDSGLYKISTAGIEVEDPIIEKPPPTKVSKVAPAGSDSSSASSFNILDNENHAKACDAPTIMSPPPSVGLMGGNSSPAPQTFLDNVSDATDCIANISSSPPFSDIVRAVVPCDNNVVDIRLTDSSSALPAEYNALMGSYRNRLEKDSASRSPLEVVRSDDYCAELAVCNDAVKSGMEKIEEFDDVKLGESCIVVDSKEFCFISPRVSNHRSYRKKIQDAFASRMRSTKQREYEQLAIWHLDLDAEFNPERAEGSKRLTLTRDVDSKKLPAYDCSESDWEIL